MSFPRYRKYKETGVAWLAAVPDHWDVRPLRYMIHLRSGGTPSKTNFDYWDGDIPWASAKDLKTQFLSDTEDHITQRAVEGGAATLVERGSLLVVVRGMILAHTFPVVTACVPMAINQDLKAIRPEASVRGSFLAWLLRASAAETLRRLDEAGHGTKALRMEAWTSMAVAVPPLDEQESITRFVDEQTGVIDALVAEQEHLVELLKEKRQAVISHAVTKGLNPKAPVKPSGVLSFGIVPAHWRISRLGFIASKIGSGKTPTGGADAYTESGVIFLRSQNVYDDGLYLDDVVYVSDAVDQEMRTSRVLPGDILLNITGASLGRTCIVPDALSAANVNQHVCIIRVADDDLRLFVAMVLKSRAVKGQCDAAQNGAAREGLNYQQIGRLVVAIPPKGEREAILAFVDGKLRECDDLIGQAERAISLFQERRAALISAAVTGKIDVRHFADAEAA